MAMRRSILVFVSASALLGVSLAWCQDEPSLGDLARQTRLQKQQKDTQASAQSKDAQGKDAPSTDANAPEAQPPKTPHVITNEDMPHSDLAVADIHGGQTSGTNYAHASYTNGNSSAEQWRSQIQAQKSSIASLQREINSVNDSVRYAPGNCVRGCAQWNDRQREKQSQVESMKAQLEEEQKRLEQMQDSARKQGLGSSVYDP